MAVVVLTIDAGPPRFVFVIVAEHVKLGDPSADEIAQYFRVQQVSRADRPKRLVDAALELEEAPSEIHPESDRHYFLPTPQLVEREIAIAVRGSGDICVEAAGFWTAGDRCS